VSDDKAPSLHLDTEKFRDLLATAVFQVLSEQSRDDLIKHALKNLIEPKKREYGYGTDPSHIQQIFDEAVRNLATDVVKEKFEEDGTKNQVRELMEEAFNKIFHDNEVRDKMTSSLAWAFRDSINKLAGLSDEAIKKIREEKYGG